MKRKIIYAVIGVFVIGFIGSVAFVKQAEAQRGKRRGMRGMAALELTDEQKEKVSDLRSAHQKAMVDLRAVHQKARIDLGEIRNEDNPSAADIQAKVDAVTAAQGKIMAREIQHNIDVKNLLTAEQKEKLGEMRRGGREGFRGRGGLGFRDNDGPRSRVQGSGFRWGTWVSEAVVLGSEITMVLGSEVAVVRFQRPPRWRSRSDEKRI